jgi:tetratricopeptide (TPR) repeat protein
LQTEIARRIAGDVDVAFYDTNTPGKSVRDINPDAQDAWLRGIYYSSKPTAEGLEKATANFDKAIELEPTFAAPYLGLAESQINKAMGDFEPPSEPLRKAEEYALKALHLDPQMAAPHAVLGWVKLSTWDLHRAENEFRRAIDLNPSLSEAYVGLGQLAVIRRRKSDIDFLFGQAIDLDPASPLVYAEAGFAQSAIGDHKLAEQLCNRALASDPESVMGLYCLGHTYLVQDQPEKAIAVLGKAVSESGIPGLRASLACAYAKNGQKQTALRTLNQLQKDYPNVSPFSIALVWEALGDHEQALRWLQKAYQARSPFLLYAGDDGNFDGLRSDVRFRQLMENAIGPEHR